MFEEKITMKPQFLPLRAMRLCGSNNFSIPE